MKKTYMSNLENTKLLETALEEYEDTQEKLRRTLNRVLDVAIGTAEAYRKIKETTIELQDFTDKISAYAENQGVHIPHAKGYVPPADSTGDIKI
jgi:hypothetical protein